MSGVRWWSALLLVAQRGKTCQTWVRAPIQIHTVKTREDFHYFHTSAASIEKRVALLRKGKMFVCLFVFWRFNIWGHHADWCVVDDAGPPPAAAAALDGECVRLKPGAETGATQTLQVSSQQQLPVVVRMICFMNPNRTKQGKQYDINLKSKHSVGFPKEGAIYYFDIFIYFKRV